MSIDLTDFQRELDPEAQALLSKLVEVISKGNPEKLIPRTKLKEWLEDLIEAIHIESFVKGTFRKFGRKIGRKFSKWFKKNVGWWK